MTSTPHDALFRSIFSQPPQARAELRAVLPAALLAQFDLDSLTALDGTFLDESLRATSADLLFSMRQRRGDDAIARLTLIALRNGRDHPRLLEHVAEMIRALEVDLRGPTVVEALDRLARYVFHVSDRPLPDVFETIGAAVGPEPRRCLMTIAERLLEAGRAEGGLAARRASLVEILETRFGAVTASDRQRIEEAPIEQLVAWIRRAAVANAAREVFETA